MDKPIVADNKPIEIQLEDRQIYSACSCENPENQPYCDESHETI